MSISQRRLKLLVVDDAPLLREVLCEQLRLLGHEPVAAENGEEAITRFVEAAPDVVLMDLVMPVMDGIAATRAIRTLPGARWVPIIMLSAQSEESEFINALKNGCDDYLVKPIKLPVLAAKILALQRIAEMHNEIENSRRQLQHFYALAEDELNLAQHIMGRLVTRGGNREIAASWSEAASKVSGDIILSAATEGGVTYTMLADATGHGLAAAITLIPVVNVFYAMAAKGFSVASIVEEMNRQVRTYCPIERFVALALVAIDAGQAVIEIWNGGIPPLLLIDAHGDEVRCFQSRHPPLGIIGDNSFKSDCEFFHYDTSPQLVMFSDGLLEAGVDEHFGLERIRAILRTAAPEQRLHAMQRAVREFLGSAKQHDDISLVLVECPVRGILQSTATVSSSHTVSRFQSDWSLQTTLSAQQLKSIDFVPMVVNWAQAMGLSKEHSGAFFLVVTELFVNALEHGVLNLSSAVKLEPNGFERFIELRQQRLQALDDGQIMLGMHYRREAGQNFIAIQVCDSGQGFSQSVQPDALHENQTPSGRGIALVKKFCRVLEYRGNGNEVYAELVC